MLDSRKEFAVRLTTALTAGLFYAVWYPKKFLPTASGLPNDLDAELARSLRKASSLSRKLARTILHSMAKHGPGLEKKQLLLARLVDIATELLTISLSAARAHALDGKEALDTARYIANRGITRCETLFSENTTAPDSEGYRLAQSMME